MAQEQETLLNRAAEERKNIFERYHRGRSADIDPWEDPAFEVYHQTDRYGFIHDKRLPQTIDINEAKLRSIELERVKKWLKMIKVWNSKETDEKLKRRIYKGIPDKLRSQVWIKLLDVEKTMAGKKNVYKKMLQLAHEWGTEIRQIDSDVNRQFRDHLFYRERYSIKQKSLFNVLAAYSMYNMEVGYCQGMAGVAAVLLMYMDEEEAFWALSTLLADKKYQMHGLYIEGFPKLNRLVQHHDRILEKCLPKLKHHFDTYNLDSMIYSLKWFFVIFIERVPFNLCLRIWDIFFYDGEKVIIAMAYNILKLHQKKLIKLKDMDLLVQYLQCKLHKDFGYDDDVVIKNLENSMEELKKHKLDIAATPLDVEFPKRPFGQFVEPTIETKIGLRKPLFSLTENKVTESVILRNDKVQHNLKENIEAKQNNTAESEDGFSLLGSSRKSLADTSVTSTADLSISIGQRSQQYDVCVDESRSTFTDAENEDENSHGSGFGSLSIMGRSPSIMLITPTPRAITPQDIVRIYVPPATLDETVYNNPLIINNNQKTPSTVNKSHSQKEEKSEESSKNRHSFISSGSITPTRQPLVWLSNEEISYEEPKLTSSRRGSLKKSLNNIDLPVCEHLKKKINSMDSFDCNKEIPNVHSKLMSSFDGNLNSFHISDASKSRSNNSNYTNQFIYKKLSSSTSSGKIQYDYHKNRSSSDSVKSNNSIEKRSSPTTNIKSELTTPVNEIKRLDLTNSHMHLNSGQRSLNSTHNNYTDDSIGDTLNNENINFLAKRKNSNGNFKRDLNDDCSLVLSLGTNKFYPRNNSTHMYNDNLNTVHNSNLYKHSNTDEFVQNIESNKIKIKVQPKH